jgi:hypothetical protein
MNVNNHELLGRGSNEPIKAIHFHLFALELQT